MGSSPSEWELAGAIGGVVATAKMLFDWLGARIKPSVFTDFSPRTAGYGRLAVVICNVGIRPFTIRRIEAVKCRGIVLWGRLWGRVSSSESVFDVVGSHHEVSVLTPGHLQVEFVDWMSRLVGASHIAITLNPKRIVYVGLPSALEPARQWFEALGDLLRSRAESGSRVVVEGNHVYLEGSQYKIGIQPLDAIYRPEEQLSLSTGPAKREGEIDDHELLPALLQKLLSEFLILEFGKNGHPRFYWTDRVKSHSRVAIARAAMVREVTASPASSDPASG